MKKQLLFILGAAALSFSTMAQEAKKPTLIPCSTYDAMEEAFKADPSLRARYESIQSQMELAYQAEMSKINANAKVAAPIYTIPVVFHIMGPQTVTDNVFENLITYINNDYAKTGSDIATIHPTFAPLYVDAEIRFALAQKDPNGNCTNGIIRHPSDNIYWNQAAPAYNYSGTGANRWPANKYLNVYIVDCIYSASSPCPPVSSFIGGYTYKPGSAPSTSADAIVMVRSQLATTDPKDSRTLSHEIGHWLNLAHTFGNSNNPGTGTCGSAQLNDGIADTPETKGYFSTCPTTFSGDCSTLPNIENIMDYSSCPKMFTQGQITKMRTALAATTAGRNNLWSAGNLLATGITSGYTCTPVADFAANKLTNCTGNTFTYTSSSEVGASGGVSWTFQNGTPATSTATSVVVTYATPGTFSVSLTATNSIGSNTMNKTSYVTVVNGANGILAPTMYDFDAASLPGNLNIINGNASTVTWAQKTASGANSTPNSIHLNNFASSNIGGHIDIFETPVYNFSNTSGLAMSYYYAYAKRVAAQADTFKIQYSLDCGGTWSNVIGVTSTAQMATASGGTLATAYTPSSFVLKTITPSLINVLNGKPSVKFRFYFRVDPTKTTANNMYLDQINITGNVVTGITELEKTMALEIYPNPTSSTSTLDFSINANEKATISLVDIMGRVLEQSNVSSDNDGHVNHTINTSGNLAAGVYIVNIDVNNQRVSKKIIVQ
jgi:PKD repeat protein